MTLNQKRESLKRILEIRKTGKTPVLASGSFLKREDGLYDHGCRSSETRKPMTEKEVDQWCDTHASIHGEPHLILEPFDEQPQEKEPK